MTKKYSHMTIEPSKFNDGEFVVYKWSKFPKSSVLAGQDQKIYVDSFSSEEAAQKEFPKAIPSAPYNPNNVTHLPDEEMSAYDEEQYFFGNDS